MAKYRYFVAFWARGIDGGTQGFSNTEIECDAPISSLEDTCQLEKEIADRNGLRSAEILNFRLFDEAPAAPDPLVARMAAWLRRFAVADSGLPCTCEVCHEARALIAEAEARVVGGEDGG